jgi:hypothetical protein
MRESAIKEIAKASVSGCSLAPSVCSLCLADAVARAIELERVACAELAAQEDTASGNRILAAIRARST